MLIVLLTTIGLYEKTQGNQCVYLVFRNNEAQVKLTALFAPTTTSSGDYKTLRCDVA